MMDEWERLSNLIICLQMTLLDAEEEFRKVGGNDQQIKLLKSYAEVKRVREMVEKRP